MRNYLFGESYIIFRILYLSVFLVFFNFIYKVSVDMTINKEAKLSLEHIRQCIQHSTGSKKPTTNILNRCLSNSLVGGSTGDVFVVSIRDKKVVWDNSLDCKTGDNSTLTLNGICNKAYDANSCVELGNMIAKGYSNSFVWYFNDNPEYGSWIILPNETLNFNGTPRANSESTDQLAIVQGVQYVEFTEYLKYIKWFVNTYIGIYLFLLVIISSIIYKKERENQMND